MKDACEIGSHVVINAHLLSAQAGYRSAGVHQYIDHLLHYLPQADSGLRYTALLGKSAPVLDARFAQCRSRWPTDRASVRVIWEQVAQPWIARKIRADLIHAPAFVGPMLTSCPTVVTIHDLSFLRFPALFRPANRLYLKVMTRLSARRAQCLIAVSAYTADETAHLIGVPRERIAIIHHGVDPAFRPLPAAEVAAFRQRCGLPEQFVLFVGTLEPRKNLTRLVEAFARIRDGRIKLVLVGGKGWYYESLFARVEELGIGEDVMFAGYAPNAELPLWYNAAIALAYPSLYEGFGLPIIEAQACGTPVLTSNVSSLPEAAGDAALLVDPYDVEELATGLNRLLHDAALQKELRERGLLRASQFTWLRAAQETARVYRRALNGEMP